MTLLLIGVLWVLSAGSLNDADIWWHLRNAEYLFQTHHLPNYDMYSFTVGGQNWMNHEWLAEVPFYIAWRSGGLVGIALMRLLLVESIFLLLLYLCWRSSGNFKASVVACFFCSFLASISFGPRMILFGYLYMVLVLVVLERFRSTGKGLWALPIIFCLWANSHGSWLLGLIVFGGIAASGLIEGRWGRVESFKWTRQQLRRLTAAGVASIAALFLNPFGYKLVIYPIQFGSKLKVPIAHVTEWASINFHEPRGTLTILLVFALLVAALLRDRRWLLADLATLLLALYCGLTYVRFLVFLAIAAAPVLAKLLDFVPPYEAEIDKPVLNAILMIVLAAAIIHAFPLPTEAAMQSDIAKEYPVEILPYLKANPPDGPLLNAFLWGGYLIWHEPSLKVFIDSRVDIFEYTGVFSDYLDLVAIKDPERILEKYQIRYVLLSPLEQLSYILAHDSRWKVNYRDEVSVLFEKAAQLDVEGGHRPSLQP